MQNPLTTLGGGGVQYSKITITKLGKKNSVQGQQSVQLNFFATIYEELIASDHLLRRLSEAVDFSSVEPLVSDCYCPDNGRPSWDPVVLFKVLFLQFLYELSDREIEEQVNLHLACKWFAGLMPEQRAPDHTTICRFRAKLGADKLRDIFSRIVEQARAAGSQITRYRLLMPCIQRPRGT